jgi:tellurite resistance protein TehA-like permease
LMAWGQGTFWWAFATIRILHSGFNKRGKWKGLTFGLSAWALVFPWVSSNQNSNCGDALC